MAEREKRGKKKQDKVEQKRSIMRKEPQTLFDRHAWEQGPGPIRETPFQPRMDEHAELIARAQSDNHRANLVLQLQQTYGNRYVQRLLNSGVVQAKLSVSAPNDIYEQEADRVAKAVTRTDKSQVQRQEEEEMLQGKAAQVQRQVEEEEEPIQPKIQRQEEEEMLQGKAAQVQRQVEEEEEPLQTKLVSEVQRQEEPEEEEEEEPVQTKLATDMQRQEEEEELQGKAAGSQPATVPEDLEARIKAERGGGHPLSDNTRGPMEQSFGADFSGVRVHTDSEADALNKQISAKAFTSGQDVFFRENEYSPGSDSGRELIAHELTHVVQQTGGQKVQSKTGIEQSTTPLVRLRRRIKGFVQRLAFENTDWRNATKASVSGGGATGVLFMEEDGSKLVVKPGNIVADEAIIAANLAGGMLGKDTGWPIDAPKTRLASLAEAQEIKKWATDLLTKAGRTRWRLPKKVYKKEREKTLLENLDRPTTIVSEYAPGMALSKFVNKWTKQTKKKWWRREKKTVRGMTPKQRSKEFALWKKRKMRKGLITQMWTDPDLMKTMGKATAMDIFMGNGDRLLDLYNPDNWRISVTKRSFHLVDNAEADTRGFLTTKVSREGKIVTAEKGFEEWLNDRGGWVKKFIASDYPGLANRVVNDILGPDIERSLREKDKRAFHIHWDNNSAKMEGWFIEGLKEGKQLLLKTLESPESLIKGISKRSQLAALTSINARRLAIGAGLGMAAWEYAENKAKMQLGVGWGEEEKD